MAVKECGRSSILDEGQHLFDFALNPRVRPSEHRIDPMGDVELRGGWKGGIVGKKRLCNGKQDAVLLERQALERGRWVNDLAGLKGQCESAGG